MTWYNKYLSVFEHPLCEVPPTVFEEISSKYSHIHSEHPLASVILIAHNEETHLLSCLWSLVNNECPYPIEILAVNNHSTDRTTEVLDKLGVHWFDEKQKGPGFARQCGLDHARGKYHICIDADTMYPPHYIATHIRELEKPNVVCTYGLWSFIPDAQHSAGALWVYETLRDVHLRIQNLKRPELNVRGMVFAFRTDVGRKIGFRTDILRGEDGSLALAMKPLGKLVFITSSKARAVTSNSTLNADGSLLKSLWVRIKKAAKGFFCLFTSRDNYDRENDTNKIN